MKVLVYNNLETNIVSVLIPMTDRISLIEIGEKDINSNIPFWIVDYSDLPKTKQETWVLESMGTPDGYGKKNDYS